MKIVKASLAAALTLIATSSAFAQGTNITAGFNVTTSVLAFCKVSAADINIAAITAGNTTGAKSNTGNVSVNCTNGTPYTLSVPATIPLGLAGSTGINISSSLALDTTSGTGAGFGNATTKAHVVTATIAEATYENARAGNYSGNTVVTLNY